VFNPSFIWGKGYVKKDLVIYKDVFMENFLEFQSYSKHKNHFDIGLKKTHFEEIQVILVDKSS
jgi:hypothetical protein